MGPHFHISLEDWRLGHAGCGCPGTNPDLTRRSGPVPILVQGWGHNATGKKSSLPLYPRPPAPSQPLGPTLHRVIGSGGRRRAGGDSRETMRLSAAICLSGRDRRGRCGPGSSRPRPPPQPDPGLRGSRARPLNRAGWRQGSGRRESGREAGDGKQLCLSIPLTTTTRCTHNARQDRMDAPSGTLHYWSHI